MNITITGKELKATEAIKDYVEKKLARIEKYFAEKEDKYIKSRNCCDCKERATLY